MNFKILTVNGQNLSGATHEEAAVAFENAPEPITVVLRRTIGRKDLEDIPVSNVSDVTMPEVRAASTQTQTEPCFCRFLLENSRNISSPLSALIMSELMRFRDSNPGVDFCDTDLYNELDPTEEDGIYRVGHERVTLTRPAGENKLGIMLCDSTDEFTNQVKVIVNDVEPNSIAALSQKICKGDQILEIDDSPVVNVEDASKLLCKESPNITFLLGHPRLMEEELEDNWDNDDRPLYDDGFDSDDVGISSQEACSRLFGDHRKDASFYGGVVASQKISSDGSGTAESALSNASTESSSQTGKDSGIGHTLDSSIQSSSGHCPRRGSLDAQMSNTGFSLVGLRPLSPTIEEFTYTQPQNYHYKKRASAPVITPLFEHSVDFSEQSSDSSTSGRNDYDFQKLGSVFENLNLKRNGKNFRSCSPVEEDFADDTDDIVSPWVRIARHDYREKIRQLKASDDLRSLHPALTPQSVCNLDTVITSFRTPSVATDNSSSAYSTGESFRSASSGAPRLSTENPSPPHTPDRTPTKANGLLNSFNLTYYMSSDANSDGDGPACYLTHNEDSDSEGFQDAGVEFSSMFTSAPSTKKPVPLPRTLHPPRETSLFMSNSLTASTKELWKAAAAVAQSRRSAMQEPRISQMSPSNKIERITEHREGISRSPNRQKVSYSKALNSDSNRDHSEIKKAAASTTSNAECGLSRKTRFNLTNDVKTKSSFEKGDAPKARRSSDHVRPNKKQLKTQRSFSCIEAPDLKDKRLLGDAEEKSDTVRMEWKVRISRDGTRYITKRPVREKVLRHREKRILAERCGVTTDDDFTEMKLGRHWSRDERKRQLRHAREKKRRREFMQRCRLEALNENAPADGEIVELSHKKMTKQKHKRMLLDNFVTVQEILAHGDRTSDVAKVNPLLSVTYI